MSTPVGSAVSPGQGEGSGQAFAVTSLIAGVTGAVLTVLAAVLTFTLWLEATIFNGPVALIAYAGLPAALVGMVCGALGLRSEARNKAIAGAALSLIVLLAWFLIVAMAPYPEP